MTLDLKKIAAEGRGGDSLLAHLTRGEVSIPPRKITPRVRGLLQEILGDELPRYTAGNKANSINPKTGLREFDEGSDGPNGANGNGGGTGGGTGGSNGDPNGGTGNGNGNGQGTQGGNAVNGGANGMGVGGGNASGGANAGPGAGVSGADGTPANGNEGVDLGEAQGPGKGMTVNGPSVAGILGAIAAALAGPQISAANTLTGTVDENGKTAASKAFAGMGFSGTPMGSVSFGGTPGDVGPGNGPGPNGPAGAGPGSDANGLMALLTNPAAAPTPPILTPQPITPVGPVAPRIPPKYWWQQSRGIG